jgi:uncharacterized protein DUF1844
MDEQQDKPGFRVTDRRRFAEATDPHEASGSPPGETTAPSRAPASSEPVKFSTLVLGLSTQVMVHLGDIESPLSGRIEQDLVAAKHAIDILGVLREKTRNNLDQAEEGLLDSILYDLRMRYVELVRGAKKEEA